MNERASQGTDSQASADEISSRSLVNGYEPLACGNMTAFCSHRERLREASYMACPATAASSSLYARPCPFTTAGLHEMDKHTSLELRSHRRRHEAIVLRRLGPYASIPKKGHVGDATACQSHSPSDGYGPTTRPTTAIRIWNPSRQPSHAGESKVSGTYDVACAALSGASSVQVGFKRTKQQR